MNDIFGLTITREQKAAPAGSYPISSAHGGWWSIVRESFTGAWQKNVSVSVDSVLTYTAVYRCIALISNDVAKMRIRLVALDPDGTWNEVGTGSPFWPVLRKPNRFQNRIQFYQNWLESKLIHGNTYVMKERDSRGIVVRLYVLNPLRVSVLVAEDSSIYYELNTDFLSTVRRETVTLPASEIIHDRGQTFQHPLVGLSPISAAGIPAMQGLSIQNNSTRFFAGGANPGGVLTAPGSISKETADRLKEYWDTNYGSGGPNVGKVAVLGDNLKYEPMMMSAVDSQLIDQLKMTGETVCAAFGVPAHMAGIGQAPTYNNTELMALQYYSQCLQKYIEDIEICLDEGLELGRNAMGLVLGTEFDLTDLLRMDCKTQMEVASLGVQRGIFSPDEARLLFNRKPVPGGDTPYMQVQNYSLAALARRDENETPVTPGLAPPPQPAETENDNADPAAAGADSADSAARTIREWARFFGSEAA